MELVVICAVVLFIFGPKRIPELARSVGKGIREYKQMENDVKQSVSVNLMDPPKPATRNAQAAGATAAADGSATKDDGKPTNEDGKSA